ncbi:MAG: XRE family transcriptional regulator [Candidatus Melainabacteria bacterium]|nr:XRE family transcriptional regulator [Candidatus Melainabacteria bacterium]
MKQKTVNGVTFLEGSDNIFRDLGFPETEAVNLLARANLMMEIEKAIEERGLTQTAAAKLLGVGQPRLSDLYKGKMERFTVDMLMKWLAKLGKQITITVADRDVA